MLLQARPITHLPEPGFPALDGQPVIWSNANLKEVLPGVPSPFNWSTVRPAIDALLSTSFRVARYPLPPGLRWIRLYQGRAYFNLSAIQWGIYEAFGTTPKELNRHLGGHHPTIPGVPAEAELRSLGRIRRWNFQAMANRAREAARLREMAKSMVIKLAGISRLLILEIGSRLAADGRLEAQEDIFFASRADVEGILAGTWDGRGLKTLVAARRARRAELLKLDPPDVVLDDAPQPRTAVPVAHGPALTGIGVASGQASGRARIIRHPEEGHWLEPGEVLVAPSTDPAWTPLFLRASALVMEVGGYLSHGAIVAREYGIPAVVNIPRLLDAVSDGTLLVVNGDAGKVYHSSRST